MTTALLTFTLFVGLIACDGSHTGSTYTPELETRHITVVEGDRNEELTVELAVTDTERAKGLMFRQELPEDWGMLFLFPRTVRGGFWMRNTYVPLDIAYIGADGRVQEIREGVPLDETILTPEESYRVVLEVNHGWFERHGMGVGSRVVVPDNLPEGE